MELELSAAAIKPGVTNNSRKRRTFFVNYTWVVDEELCEKQKKVLLWSKYLVDFFVEPLRNKFANVLIDVQYK